MQKDIIYIDVDDDITAIIGKVKAAKEKIVALVPPKRIGVLQSAVNLRLLERAAGQQDKKLVLITSNKALSSLAAAAKIPVAKNLQSRPELGEIAALDVDDGDDLIDGAQLSVGEHAKQAAGAATATAAAADVISDSDLKNIDVDVPKASAPAAGAAPSPKVKGKPKVPNFSKFRKRLVLIGGGCVLLIIFLIWAIFFAGRATVYITAKTTDASVNDTVTLSPSATTDPSQKLLRDQSQQLQKNVSISFNATGTKNAGDTATGSVTFQECTGTPSTPGDVPSGTTITSSGNQYTTGQDASFTFDHVGSGCIVYTSNSVSVTAAAPGTAYNVSNGAFTVNGDSSVSGSGSVSGGTDKNVQIVTKSDVAQAMQKLTSQNTDSIKSQLESQFGKNVKVIGDTFKADTSAVKPNPAVDGEADSGTGTLSGTVTYTMLGVAESEINTYLNGYFNDQLQGQSDQRIYNNGAANANFSNTSMGSTVTSQLTADGKIGPKIDDNTVKKLAEGKRLGDIQSALKPIQGVSNVDVKYWPFWVSKAPNNPNRISVVFKVDGK
ncbi:MAG TPA: hypothetical protein VFQ70_04120 [Candidatus Saccharimonadaceae bacterium]|nr:hypothetical protein [Candidatus Saccharimonadaceae bacterium]